MKYLHLLVLVLFLGPTTMKSQINLDGAVQVKEPLWNLNTVSGNKEVAQDPFMQVSEHPGWMHVASSGYLVFSGGGKIKGIEPEEGNLAWNSKYTEDLPAISTGSFEEIPNTPYFAVVDRKQKKGQFIMSTIDGKVAANTGEDGLPSVGNRFTLPGAGRLLFTEGATFASYDLNDPSKKWIVEKMFKYADGVLKTAPLELNEKEFVIGTDLKLFKINSQTGEIIWSQRTHMGTATTMSWSNEANDTRADKPSRFFRFEGDDFFYFQTDAGIMAYDIATGDKKWKKSAKATEESLVVFDPKGMITFADKVYMYDYATGEKLWDKPMKMTGAAEFAAYAPQGLVIGIRKLNIRKVPYFELNCLDPDLGNFRFDDNFKLEGNLLEMWPCDAGVFYTTDRELNIWDASTGKNAMTSIAVTATSNFFDIKSWDYSAPPNGLLLTAFKDQMAYIFNTETKHLFSVNTATGAQKQLTAGPLVFEDGKTANQIETREGGIFLASSQSATLLDFEGHEIYRVHLPVAKKGFLWKMMAAAAVVYQQQRTANNAVRQSSPQLNNNDSKTRSEFARKMYGAGVKVEVNVDAAKAILGNRFEKSKQGKNSYYIFSQLAQKAGGWLDGEYGLVKVNKDSGKIEKYISFGKNMEPNFIIDEISGRLFYASGNRILCFDMN